MKDEEAAALGVTLRVNEVLFRAGDIAITRSMAKIGNATYPIVNIGSVVIERRPIFLAKLSVFLGTVFGLIVGYIEVPLYGIGIFVASIIVFHLFPQRCKLTLRTSSGDVTALDSGNVELVERVHEAIESAFVR